MTDWMNRSVTLKLADRSMMSHIRIATSYLKCFQDHMDKRAELKEIQRLREFGDFNIPPEVAQNAIADQEAAARAYAHMVIDEIAAARSLIYWLRDEEVITVAEFARIWQQLTRFGFDEMNNHA